MPLYYAESNAKAQIHPTRDWTLYVHKGKIMGAYEKVSHAIQSHSISYQVFIPDETQD